VNLKFKLNNFLRLLNFVKIEVLLNVQDGNGNAASGYGV